MLSTLLVVGVISHLWCAARLVGIAHHSFYSVGKGSFCQRVLQIIRLNTLVDIIRVPNVCTSSE